MPPKLQAFVIISSLVIVVQIISGLVIYLSINNWNDRSSFGEMFGFANTLFSGLAFAGVIYAILLQRRELELQRRELELTRNELARTAEAQEKSETALTEQAKALSLTAQINALMLIPAISCQIERRRSEIFINISNIGNNSAFNVDVLLITSYYSKYMSLKQFIQSYVPEVNRNRVSISTVDDLYGVSDHLSYPIFPFRKQVNAPIYLPGLSNNFKILLQFRDIQGQNYYQIYWFFDEKWRESVRVDKNNVTENEKPVSLTLSGLYPTIPKVTPRIEPDLNTMGRTLTIGNNQQLPDNIRREFGELWECSVSADQTLMGKRLVEDMGTWTDI